MSDGEIVIEDTSYEVTDNTSGDSESSDIDTTRKDIAS